jgi:hypothetical protein
MKRVVSLSLGSSKRDKYTTQTLLGETFEIRREGTDGDQARFIRRLAELDGTVDAIGFGGMDRYLWSEGRRYEFAAAKRLLAGATKTPVLDGSGLKNTLEREAVRSLAADGLVDFRNSRTLMVCGVDRFGMSEALAEQGGALVFGDLMFALGLPFAIRSWPGHRAIAKVLLPLIVQMPLSVLYPMGEKQEQITPRWGAFYRWADVLAGDFHYIRRFLPAPGGGDLRGKVLLTNTITEDDVADLSRRGVRMLVTTTPNFDGRSFATNVMEAVIVALHGGRELSPDEYLETLRRLNWTPTVRELGATTAAPE